MIHPATSLSRRTYTQRLMHGHLEDYPIADLLQFFQGVRKQFHLLIERTEPRESAGIYFAAGRPVHAYLSPLEGEEALISLMTWECGRFLVIDDAVSERQTIDSELQSLLLEGARRLDDSRRFVAHKPKATSIPVPSASLNEQSDDLLLTLREWRLLAAIDGRRTVHELSLLLACDLSHIQTAIVNLLASDLIRLDHQQAPERGSRMVSRDSALSPL
jgi:Domain of unknown function (DUF4388)